jgi:hypothetical protein
VLGLDVVATCSKIIADEQKTELPISAGSRVIGHCRTVVRLRCRASGAGSSRVRNLRDDLLSSRKSMLLPFEAVIG